MESSNTEITYPIIEQEQMPALRETTPERRRRPVALMVDLVTPDKDVEERFKRPRIERATTSPPTIDLTLSDSEDESDNDSQNEVVITRVERPPRSREVVLPVSLPSPTHILGTRNTLWSSQPFLAPVVDFLFNNSVTSRIINGNTSGDAICVPEDSNSVEVPWPRDEENNNNNYDDNNDEVEIIEVPKEITPEATEHEIQHALSSMKCRICLEKMRNTTATNCGHVFCKKCIERAIRSQKRCPLCRKRLTLRSIHPLFL